MFSTTYLNEDTLIVDTASKPKIRPYIVRSGYNGVVRARGILLIAFGKEYLCSSFPSALEILRMLYKIKARQWQSCDQDGPDAPIPGQPGVA